MASHQVLMALAMLAAASAGMIQSGGRARWQGRVEVGRVAELGSNLPAQIDKPWQQRRCFTLPRQMLSAGGSIARLLKPYPTCCCTTSDLERSSIMHVRIIRSIH